MRTARFIFILIFGLCFATVQTQTIQEQEREKNKVKLFTEDEFANLHMWFYKEVQKMNLSENADNEYSRIINHHMVKMARLDDKDVDYPKTEIIKKFNVMFDEMNAEMKPVLNKEQFDQHLEIITVLSRAILNKLEAKEE